MTTMGLTSTFFGIFRHRLLGMVAAVLITTVLVTTAVSLVGRSGEISAPKESNPEVQNEINNLRGRIEGLKELAKANPGYALAVEELAGVYLQMGALQQADGQEADSQRSYRHAIEQYERYLTLKPNDEDGTIYLSLAQLNLGNSDEAIRLMEEQSRRRPGSQKTWYGLGWVYAKAGRATESEWAYTKALNIDPNSAIGQTVKEFLATGSETRLPPNHP